MRHASGHSDDRARHDQLWFHNPSLDAARAVADYQRLMSREANRLTAIRNRGHSQVPSTLVLRSWPHASRELLDRLPNQVAVPYVFGRMAADAPIFMIDTKTLIAAVASGDQAPEVLPLPPLPFESIAVETFPTRFAEHADGVQTFVESAMITEIHRGTLWEVWLLAHDDAVDGSFFLGHLRIHGDGTFETGNGHEWRRQERSHFSSMLIEAVHIITARGVTHEHPRRPIRRDYERVTGRKWPTNAWLIQIGSSADSTDNHTDRRLTCRFRVRGHWARLSDKKVPSGHVPWREDHDGFLVWRDAFIKGPAGAPWRVPADPVRIRAAKPA